MTSVQPNFCCMSPHRAAAARRVGFIFMRVLTCSPALRQPLRHFPKRSSSAKPAITRSGCSAAPAEVLWLGFGTTIATFESLQRYPSTQESSHSLKDAGSDCEFSCLPSSRSKVCDRGRPNWREHPVPPGQRVPQRRQLLPSGAVTRASAKETQGCRQRSQPQVQPTNQAFFGSNHWEVMSCSGCCNEPAATAPFSWRCRRPRCPPIGRICRNTGSVSRLEGIRRFCR